MTKQPKLFIQSLYEAFGRGDADTVLGALDAHVQWNEAEGSPLAADNPYVGPQQVGEGVIGRLVGDYEGFTVTPRTYVAEGNDVVVLGRYTGTRKDSGQTLDAQFVHHWTVEDGRVMRFQQYTDTAQWSALEGDT
jgi:ketosteroid isomerase-like protein